MTQSKIAPAEPTEEMIDAASRWFFAYQHTHLHDKSPAIAEAYKAMIAHCPDAPDVEGLRADAARYRWLKAQSDVRFHVLSRAPFPLHPSGDTPSENDIAVEWYGGVPLNLDAAIDSAIAALAKDGNE